MLRIRLFAFGLLILGLVLGYFAFADRVNPGGFLAGVPFRLGLDLQGGAHLVYRADTSAIPSSDIKESMEGLRDVIERRVNAFGVSEPVVQVERSGAEHRLIVELAGVFDIGQAIQVIGFTPYLEFKNERLAEARDEILAAQEKKERLGEDAYFVSSGLTGRFLKRAVMDFDPTTGQPTVLLEFNTEGKDLFARLTRENVGKRIAIYLDGLPITAPVVQEEINSGQAQITGQFTPAEARLIVRRLNSGALPVPIELVSQQSVGATLGNEAFRKGMYAGLYGIAAVALFLILRYRLLGFLAVLSLGFYVVCILTAFKLLPVTLSAAGIAGFLLSIGMAVDANILVFERMREEVRWGRALETASHEGFRRAWPSIRDSNISSLITAAILYWFGSSIIRGFALTLGIGILASMFSGLVVTRMFLYALGFGQSRIRNFLYRIV
ncbi:MAG: protein translocase subunit SecD [Candidatus Niyogibacteria bacterium]|nr:protein translocase subunit SecD [Candidatus Niyogibacteria bacterium]